MYCDVNVIGHEYNGIQDNIIGKSRITAQYTIYFFHLRKIDNHNKWEIYDIVA